MNLEPRTSNRRLPASRRARAGLGCLVFDAGCLFLLHLFFATLAASAQTNDLPALAPPYGELPPTFCEQHGAAALLGAGAFLAFAFLLTWLWLRPADAVRLSPDASARQALTAIQGQPETGTTLSAVSQILRRYIAETFSLADGELTTAEFCALAAGNEAVGVEIAGIISSFLRECDVRKFSPARSAAPLNAATRALDLVALAEKRRAERREVILPAR